VKICSASLRRPKLVDHRTLCWEDRRYSGERDKRYDQTQYVPTECCSLFEAIPDDSNHSVVLSEVSRKGANVLAIFSGLQCFPDAFDQYDKHNVKLFELTYRSLASLDRPHPPRICSRARGFSASIRFEQEAQCYAPLESGVSTQLVARHASRVRHGHHNVREQLNQGQGEPLRSKKGNASCAGYVMKSEATHGGSRLTMSGTCVFIARSSWV